MMRQLTWLTLVITLACTGCAGNEPTADTPHTTAANATMPTGLISDAVVNDCAGFDREMAARYLGVDAAVLNDYSRIEGSLRYCLYRQPDNYANTVSFTLSRRDSIDAAKASMDRERESMAMADRAIGGVTGNKSKEAATDDVSGLGDDAFYSPMNGAIMLRVGNVIAQVTGPKDIDKKKIVAAAVARGLRS